MQSGDFYSSTDVILKDVVFDPETKTLWVEVDPKPGVKCTIEFIGTRCGVSTKMTDDDLYICASVRSDRKMPLACPKPQELQMEEAFTQPVGF